MNLNQFRARRRLPCPLALLIAVVALASAASAERKEKVLYSFQGIPDGAVPAGGVAFDQQGNLYGATTNGGASNCQSLFDCGTVFELSPPAKKGDPWVETVLYIFKGVPSKDGALPFGGLVIDESGNLYGTTGYGGAGTCLQSGTNVGCGTVYELSPPEQKGEAWTETVLHSFKGDKDGELAWGGLLFDGAGNLYGATEFGGGYGVCNAPYYQHCGTIFEVSPPKQKGGQWTEKVLYSFRGGKDGANPNGGLVFDNKGAIYGATEYGGSTTRCPGTYFSGCGTVFKLVPANKKGHSWTEDMVHSFTNGADGGGPNGGLIFDAKGSIYGTAGSGGTHLDGVVFRLTLSTGNHWMETVLYNFTQLSDGGEPNSGLTLDRLGNLYGTALGGTSFRGVVFRLKIPTRGRYWAFATLYNFNGSTDGHWPEARVVSDAAGNLYGTTLGGGTGTECTNGCGTVFEVSP